MRSFLEFLLNVLGILWNLIPKFLRGDKISFDFSYSKLSDYLGDKIIAKPIISSGSRGIKLFKV